jgi:two-component system chemotaxis response regulator CheB
VKKLGLKVLASKSAFTIEKPSQKKTYFFEAGFFLCFYKQDQIVNTISYFEKANFSTDDLLRLVKQETHSEAQVKIITFSQNTELLKQTLKEANCSVVKLIEREDPFEIIFDPTLQKLQISKVNNLDNKQMLSKSKKNNKQPALTRVLIVDDSATVRSLLRAILSSDKGIQVVAEAEKPSAVEDLIFKFKPDVITLDVYMPEQDGITFYKEKLKKLNIPTVLITSISINEGPQVLQALSYGVVDYIQKPTMSEIKQQTPVIIEKIKAAALAKINFGSLELQQARGNLALSNKLILIGASTGGTEALTVVLKSLPSQIPPILIVQHMPSGFTKSFAERLNQMFEFEVKEAEDGDEIKPNKVLIAPGGLQMGVKTTSTGVFAQIKDAEPVNRHKPSVDYLFNDVAAKSLTNIIAVVLTGMGADGAKGMKLLKSKGAFTIAQNEETCVVFGMPREAIALNAACEVVPLNKVSTTISDFILNEKKYKRSA